MDQKALLRNLALYQKSWVSWSCDHSRNQSRASTSRSGQSALDLLGPKGGVIKLNKRKPVQTSTSSDSKMLSTTYNPRRTRSNQSVMPMVHVSIDPLSSRRSKRIARSRPWAEDIPKAVSRPEEFEMVYEAYLPKDRWVEYRAREYVTNPRYGQLYEIRKDKPRPQRQDPPPSWLWEDRFRLWRFEMANPRTGSGKSGVTHSSMSDITRGRFVESKQVKPADSAKPHADLFAAYHNQKLTNQRRVLACTVIQRWVRGWLIRKHIKDMKRHALLGLGRAWPKVTKEYRELVTRIQARHGVMKTSCPFALQEMDDYITKRENYEHVFEKTAQGDKLSRDQLSEFMEGCGLYPTEGEITAAFNAVFRGSGSTAEVVFVLDCSSSLGVGGFRDQLTFVKDVVRTLDVAPDRVRVGVVPYNTDVFQVSGLLQHRNQGDVIQALDQIKFRPGLTHTDIALTIMRDVFKDSRPGVQKLAIVVTDGQSANTQQTALEAKKAADENITVFAVGVGNNAEEKELQDIARDASRVFKCSSYRALISLKHLVSSKLCLRACTLCQHVLPRVLLHGLYRNEALEILFTLFVLPATRLLPQSSLSTPKALSGGGTQHSPTRNALSGGGTQHSSIPNALSGGDTQRGSSNLTAYSDEKKPSPLGGAAEGCPDAEVTSAVAVGEGGRTVAEGSAQEAEESELEKKTTQTYQHPEPRREQGVLKPSSGKTTTQGRSEVAGSISRHKSRTKGMAVRRELAESVEPGTREGQHNRMNDDSKTSQENDTTTSLSNLNEETNFGSEEENMNNEDDAVSEDLPFDRNSLENVNTSTRDKTLGTSSKVFSQSSESEDTENWPLLKTATAGAQNQPTARRSSPDGTKDVEDDTATPSLTDCSTSSASVQDVSMNCEERCSSTQDVKHGLTFDTSTNGNHCVSDSERCFSYRRGDNFTSGDTSPSHDDSDALSGNSSDNSSKVKGNNSSRMTDDHSSKMKEDDHNYSSGMKGGNHSTSSRMRGDNSSRMKGDNSTRMKGDNRSTVPAAGGSEDRPQSPLRGTVQDVCRPLTKGEALDVVWTIYPPTAAGLPSRSSRWIRPVLDGQEAWAFLDENLMKSTDFKVCLGLVVKARLEREGYITIPSDVRAGVEEVTTYDDAMRKIEEYLAKKKGQE